MDAHQDIDPREARANVLYWDSDESVNDIAAALDLSKGTLYGMIQPRPSGIVCPECANEMEYPNRTAREKGFVTCPACGLEEEEDVVLAVSGEAARRVGAREAAGEKPSGALLASVFLGAAAGIVLTRWLRRR